VRAVLVGVAVLAGYWLFSLDPLWAGVTVIIVLQPGGEQTVITGIQRAAGSVLGGVATVILIESVSLSEAALVTGLLVAAALCLMFYKANYFVYAIFVTASLIFYEVLAVDNAFEAGEERIAAILLGVGLALVGLLLQHWMKPRESQPA